MNRFVVLDSLRGYFLVFMVVNHLSFPGGTLLDWVNHAQLGFVEDAQGFVFLSGLIVGLYYTRMLDRWGSAAVSQKLFKRAYELYVYATLLLAALLILAVILPDSRAVWGHFLGHIYENPALHSAAGFLLIYQPTFMDILPQYIVYLLVSPWLLRLIADGRWAVVLGGSLFLWLLTQLGWHLFGLYVFDKWTGLIVPGLILRGAFNPLAWQVVFVAGLLLGAAEARNRIDHSRWFSPRRLDLLAFATALFVLFLAYRVGYNHDLVPGRLAERFDFLMNRQEFSLVYFLNFAATGYVVTWLIRCGPEATIPALRAIGIFLNRLLRTRFLTFLGKHSLQVYAYHVVMVYLLVAFHGWFGPISEIAKAVIGIAAIASLLLPALLHERYRTLSVLWAGRAEAPERRGT